MAQSVSLLPKNGYALHGQKGLTFIADERPAAERRNVLARILSELHESNNPENSSPDPVMQELRSHIALSGGEQHAWHTQSTNLDFRRLRSSGLRIASDNPNIRWEELRRSLTKQNFSIRLRTIPPSSTIVNPDNLFETPEVYSQELGVIAEGKGREPTAALYSAIAEACERITASTMPAHMRIASANELEAQGIMTPTFTVGDRDAYSSSLPLAWTPAEHISGSVAALPVEISHYRVPPPTGVHSFFLQHTTGLAAGASVEEAIIAGLFEILERDAYWIVMRCRLACANLNRELWNVNARHLVGVCERIGLRAHVKQISLNWPIPIVHVLLEDTSGRIPAFAHGVGAHFDVGVATERALYESLQVRSGLQSLVSKFPEAVLQVSDSQAPAPLSWSSPAFKAQVEHLMSHCRPSSADETCDRVQTVTGLIEWLEARHHRIFFSKLADISGLTVVRVFVEHAEVPDHTWDRAGLRVRSYVQRFAPRGPYFDPILI